MQERKPEDYQSAAYHHLSAAHRAGNGAEPRRGKLLLAKSDYAIRRRLAECDTVSSAQYAEAYALKGRSRKARWIAWTKASAEKRAAVALRSPFRKKSFKAYERAYYGNLNHYYSGINAPGLPAAVLNIAARCLYNSIC